MKGVAIIGAGLLALSGITGPALAGSSGMSAQPQLSPQTQETINQLQDASADIARSRELSEHHGVMLSEDIRRQSQLDSLIQRLQNGENVSPDEIEQAKR